MQSGLHKCSLPTQPTNICGFSLLGESNRLKIYGAGSIHNNSTKFRKQNNKYSYALFVFCFFCVMIKETFKGQINAKLRAIFKRLFRSNGGYF